MQGSEKRKFPRLFYNVGMEYQIMDEPEKRLEKVYSKNISAGGICIMALEKLHIGANLMLKFSLPNSNNSINATGTVSWIEEFSVGDMPSSKAYDVGVQFTEISESDKEKVNQFVITRV